MAHSTVVLLSGGQDSTTALFWAKHRLHNAGDLHTLSLYYGQRHATELDAARTISQLAGAKSHVSINIDRLFSGDNALTGDGIDIEGSGGMPDKEMPNGLPTTFVPARNLVFLALAAAHAGRVGASAIVTGVCQTDYSGYPDCRMDFIHAMQDAIAQAWPNPNAGFHAAPNRSVNTSAPRIVVPLMRMTKAETVKLMRELAGFSDHASEGERLITPEWRSLSYSITCYRGQRPGCGVCPACELRAKGFAEAGLKDPSITRWTV